MAWAFFSSQRTGTSVLLAAGLGLALGVVLVRAPRPRSDASEAVSISGQRVAVGPEGATQAALELVRRAFSEPFYARVPEEALAGDPEPLRIPISYRALGVQVDRARFDQLLRDAADPASPTNRLEPLAEAAGLREVAIPIELDPERSRETLRQLKARLDRTVRDARLSPLGVPPKPERRGRLLDLDASLLAIERAIERGQREAALVFHSLEPRRSAEQLRGVSTNTVLGHFETPYDSSRRARARTFNLRLAASRLRGAVLLPGDVFDFNAAVGPSDDANGYRVAPSTDRQEGVGGIGAGTCQISGTLYAAALFAGLEVLERTPHRRLGSYIEPGFDAAVVYPTVNLRLRNPYRFPIVLQVEVKEGRVRAEIRGPSRPKQVTLIRRIDAAEPFPVHERPDPGLPRGAKRVARRGVPGLTLHRYRILREGDHSVRETHVDHYPPRPQVELVGTGSSGLAVPRSAPLSSFAPDELLVVSQQREPGAPHRVQREPGRFGVAGWVNRRARDNDRTGG